MEIRGKYALGPGEIEKLMLDAWIIRLATIGPGQRINLTPLWFCWAEGNIYTFTRENWRWIVITPDLAFSWDNRKLGRGSK